MKLIVEAGSTKTDSILIGPNGAYSAILKSPGINPVGDHHHLEAVRSLMVKYESADFDQIYYYGSGCINDRVNGQLAEDIIKYTRKDVSIEVHDDLMAVARACCDDNPGVISILGTGSNSAYYNGSSIVAGVKSCGYLLGDEGSGFCLGVSLLRRFARGQFPNIVQELIEEQSEVNADDVISKVYHQLNRRQYIASFAKIIKSLPEQYKNEIVSEVFEPYVREQLLPLSNRYKNAIHISGSIAYSYQSELKQIMQNFNIAPKIIQKSPLNGLITYHSHE